MDILSSETKTEAIDAVQPHPRNPREGDVGAIHQSIEANGFYGTIVAQKSTGYILAGNHRWQAMAASGAKEIPVTWLDIDDDHATRILLADNRTNDVASYDVEALSNLLQELAESTHNLQGTGYDGDDLDELIADINQDWYKPELAPNLSNHQHTDEDVEKAKEKLATQFDNDKPLRDVMCPKCGEVFYID